MQSALDGADGRVEFSAHLDQGASVEVEGFEGFPIHRSELSESSSDLIFSFPREDGDQGRPIFDVAVFDQFAIAGHARSAPDGIVDGHPRGDGSNPSAEASGIFELIELPHRLDEHVLAEFLRFGVIAQPTEDGGINGLLVVFDQAAERLPVAVLRSLHQVRGRVLDDGSQAERCARCGFVFGVERYIECHDYFHGKDEGKKAKTPRGLGFGLQGVEDA
jgi:hypothetical protein